jgi:glycosyltransferase involved in cell wall biosynthesis
LDGPPGSGSERISNGRIPVKILMVTPYPPLRDGIANYAVQQVSALRRQGHDVEVLSPGPSAAHQHLDLHGPRGSLALAKRVRRFDKVVVQYHPNFFYDSHEPLRRIETDLALLAAFKAARNVEVRMHEVDYGGGEAGGLRGRAARAVWRAADAIYFHSDAERQRFVVSFGGDNTRCHVIDHGRDFVPRTRHDRASARASLNVPVDRTVFLSIGFIQRHKGFDHAVRAFAGLGDFGARFDIVGSLRLEVPDFVRYLGELEALVSQTPEAYLHEGYVSDELFDRWIVAADVVVLPYREIWSSGVLERAALLGRPVIATRVGGLADQSQGHDVTLVENYEGLRREMWAQVGQPAAQPSTTPWPGPGPELWERTQAEVLRRAAGHGTRDRVSQAESLTHALARDVSAPLRRLPLYTPPPLTSNRPVAGIIKRVVRRLTGWQLLPLEEYTRSLHESAVRSAERAGDALEAYEHDQLADQASNAGTPADRSD